MTYQHAPRQRVHKYTMSFGDAILYLSRLISFLNTLGVHLTHRVRFFWFKRDLWQYNRPSLTLGWEALHWFTWFGDLVYYPHCKRLLRVLQLLPKDLIALSQWTAAAPVSLIKAWQPKFWQYNRPSLTLGWEELHRFGDLVYYPHWQAPVVCFTIHLYCTFTVDRSLACVFWLL